MKQESSNWRTLLNRWISGEADRSDERSLEAMAKDDHFLADALEGYRSLPEADHARSVTRLKANLRKRTEKKDRAIVFYLTRIAAVGVVLLGAWLVFRSFDDSEKTAMNLDLREEVVEDNMRKDQSAATNQGLAANEEMVHDDSTFGNNALEFSQNTTAGNYNDVASENTPSAVRAVPPPTINENVPQLKQDGFAGQSEKVQPALAEEEAQKRMETVAKQRLAESDKAKEKVSRAKESELPKKTEDALVEEAESAPQADEFAIVQPEAAPPPAPKMEDAPVTFNTFDDVAAAETVISQTIKGQVTDDNGYPLIGVSIVIQNSSKGTVTDLDGNFSIDSPIENPVLEVSYTGFQNQKIQVKGDEFLNIQLDDSASSLSEVVVTKRNLGILKKNKAAAESPFEPKGGFKKFEKYIKENLQKPQLAIDAGISGAVILGFTIDASGQPTKIQTLRSLGFGCDEEAIRLLQEGPKWNGQPGVQHSYTFDFK
ncbi:MAG: carboxypeptidase-like regulatory domain-containing protein [Saprospiraceae bacterium]